MCGRRFEKGGGLDVLLGFCQPARVVLDTPFLCLDLGGLLHFGWYIVFGIVIPSKSKSCIG